MEINKSVVSSSNISRYDGYFINVLLFFIPKLLTEKKLINFTLYMSPYLWMGLSL